MPDFPPQLPHGQITQVLPEVFFVTGQMRIEAPDRPILTSRNMTVIRTGTELTLANTVRLDAGGLAEIDALGEVKHVAKLGQFHGRDDAFYLDRYGAEFWAPDGMTHDRGEVTDCVLAPDQAGPSNDASVFLFETASKPEVILHLDRHGGILVSCDSLHNWSGPDEWFDDYSAQGLLPLLPVTPDVDRPSTFQARFLDRAGRCAGAFGLGEVGFECCQAGWRAGTRP